MNNCQLKFIPKKVTPEHPDYEAFKDDYYYLSEYEYNQGERTTLTFDDSGMASFIERQNKLYPSCKVMNQVSSKTIIYWMIAIIIAVAIYHQFFRK